jgi:hypothetical protein
MGRTPLLECFDPALLSSMSAPEPGPGPDWLDGHAQGMVEGRARVLAEQATLSAEMGQTLADMAFGYAEARAHILHGLTPLFRLLIGKLLPHLSGAAMSSHVIGLLTDAAAQDSAQPMELSVHPARIAALTELLPYAVGLPVVLVADPGIGIDQAVLRSGQSETALDVGAVIAGAQAAFEAIFVGKTERAHHG